MSRIFSFIFLFYLCVNYTFADESQKYIDLLNKMGTQVALQVFQDDLKLDKNFQDVCHPVAHKIGAAVYQKFGIAYALKNRTDVCGSGYIHGAIEQFVAEHKKFNFKKVCAVGDDNCFHGLGHGLMLTHNDKLKTSLGLCDKLANINGIYNCYDGVWMEYFGDGTSLDISILVNNEKPEEICKQISAKYRANCYFYLPRYFLSVNKDDLSVIENICQNLKIKGLRKFCFKGLGSGYLKNHISDSVAVKKYYIYLKTKNIESAKEFWQGVDSYKKVIGLL